MFQITSGPPTVAVRINKGRPTSLSRQAGVTKAPVVMDNAVAYLEVKVTQKMDVRRHTIFTGNLVGADVISNEECMTYAYYHQVKRGTTHKAAPRYIAE